MFTYMDRSGSISQVISCTSASNFTEGMAIIEIGNEHIALDHGLKVLWRKNKADYRTIDPPTNGRLRAVDENGKYGFLDANGNTAVEFRYSYALGYSDYYAIVERDQISSVIDSNGCNWEMASHGRPIGIGNQKICIDVEGAIRVFDLNTRESFTTNLRIGTYSEGLVPFLIEGKNGFIDHRGNIAIPAAFDRVTSVRCGVFFSYSKKENFWTMRDRFGNKLSDLKIVEPGSISENRVFVVAKRKRILLDMSGNELWSEEGVFHLGEYSAGISRCDYAEHMIFMNSDAQILFKKSKAEIGYSGKYSESSPYCPIFLRRIS